MYIDMNAYDPVIEEVYAIRRKISEECGHDIHRLFELMRRKRRDDEAAGIVREYVHLPTARLKASPAYPSIPADTGVLRACESAD